MKKLFHSRRIAKTLLCAITALTIGTNAYADGFLSTDSVGRSLGPLPDVGWKHYPSYQKSDIDNRTQDKVFPHIKIRTRCFFYESIYDKMPEKLITKSIKLPEAYLSNNFLTHIFLEEISNIETESTDLLNGFFVAHFTINKDGSISKVELEHCSDNVTKDYSSALLTYIKNMPNWKPATVDGTAYETVAQLTIYIERQTPLTDNLAQSTQGFYKLDKIGREDGSVIDSPFDQYLLCMDNYSLFLFLSKPTHKQDIIDFTIERKYPAEVLDAEPVLESKKDEWLAIAPLPKVYDINKKGFTLKWFNNYRGYVGGPYGSWITETWKRNKSSKAADIMMSTLKTKESDKNPFWGVWKHKWSNFYKIYGKDYSIILYGPAGGWTLKRFKGSMSGNVRSVEYIDKNLTKEGGGPCLIEWIDNDNFKLNYRSGITNKISAEEWERVDAESNDDVYEIINDIINCK